MNSIETFWPWVPTHLEFLVKEKRWDEVGTLLAAAPAEHRSIPLQKNIEIRTLTYLVLQAETPIELIELAARLYGNGILFGGLPPILPPLLLAASMEGPRATERVHVLLRELKEHFTRPRMLQRAIGACVDEGKNTPLHLACSYYGDLDTIQALVDTNPGALLEVNSAGQLPVLKLWDDPDTRRLFFQKEPAEIMSDPSLYALIQRVDYLACKLFAVYSRSWLPSGFQNNKNNFFLHGLMRIIPISAIYWKRKDASSPGVIRARQASIGELFELAVKICSEDCAMARDSHGNLALHRYLMSDSYRENVTTLGLKELLKKAPQAASIPNYNARLPLQFAIRSSCKLEWEDGIDAIVEAYPAALCRKVRGWYPFQTATQYGASINTIYNLLRAKPDLLSN